MTPHDADLGGLSRAAGVGHVLVERAGELGSALNTAIGAGGLQVVEVAVDPVASLARREALRETIGDSLA